MDLNNIDFSKIKTQPTDVFYLKMDENPCFKLLDTEGMHFEKLKQPINVQDYRKHYFNVGFEWNWLDRLVMLDDELSFKINQPSVDIFILKVNNEAAGFAEFMKEESFTEILYFGLYPDFIGKGLGKFFLKWVINQAWSYKPRWIQLNTCSLDHENALSVYQSMGFKIVETTVEERKILLNTEGVF